MFIIIFFLTASCVMMLSGIAWILRDRGITTRRFGAEIGAEILAENLARQNRLDGKPAQLQKSFFWGKGWAVQREAAMSYKELKSLIAGGDLRLILPVMLTFAGMVGMGISMGFLFLNVFDSMIPGILFFLFFIYGLYVAVSGFIRA